MIPLAQTPVRAGFCSPAEDAKNTTLDLEAMLVRRPAATFMMKVSGEAMAGAGIHEGDMLIVDRSIAPRAGLAVVAVVDGELTVKRMPVGSAGAFEVWGVVTYCIRQLA